MASRAQVASWLADKLPDERAAAVETAASWLVASRRVGQANYLARDVARELAFRGYVYARVTSARPLGHEAQSRIREFITEATQARQLELDIEVDPRLVGGVRIETPDAELDASVRTKLEQFVEGVNR